MLQETSPSGLRLTLERCIQSAVTTMWGIPLAGSRISLPILQRSSSFRSYFFFSHYLLILYHRWRQMSSLYYCVDSVIGKGIEPHPTDEFHTEFFLTTLRLMERPLSLTQPCRRELSRFAIPFSFSTYIISNLAAKVKGLLIFFNNNYLAHPPSLLVL